MIFNKRTASTTQNFLCHDSHYFVAKNSNLLNKTSRVNIKKTL